MVDRKKLAGLVAAGLLLAAGGVSVAVSASEEAAPSGQAEQVSQPRSLSPQGPRAVGAFERPASAPPIETRQILAQNGIKNAKLARKVGGKGIYVGQMDAGFLCLSVAGAEGRVTSTCQTPETISQGHLWLAISGAVESEPRVYGVAPDGVSEVLLTDAQGQNNRTAVVNNIYAAPQDSQTARIEWDSPNGAKADLRLPVAAPPPPAN